MPDLNLSIDYFDHPKTKRLIRLLGKGSEVLPIKLWVYTARYFADDGILTGISAQEIEAECGWWGEPGKMVDDMLQVKFLYMYGNALAVHQWTEHEGHISAFKERAKVANKARWEEIRGKKKPNSVVTTSNATSITTRNPPTDLPALPTKPTKEPPAGFERFWKAWPKHPRKVNRRGCLKAWHNGQLEPRADAIVLAVEAWKASGEWAKESGRFIPLPLTWLNQERWDAAPEQGAESSADSAINAGLAEAFGGPK